MKIDILAVGVHPDDVELGCSGTLARHIAAGKTAAVLDLTLGELGTRGSAELRVQEAARASEILKLSFRQHLDFKDGFFRNDEQHQMKIIEVIRFLRPEVVLCNAISDRHPDHGRAAQLVSESCFYSGLRKIITRRDDKSQEAWRPRAVYHYIQDRYLHPDFVIDITEYHDIKHRSIMAYSSQFYNVDSAEPATPISGKDFLESLDSKMAIWGRAIGARYAEGFTAERYPGLNSLFDLI